MATISNCSSEFVEQVRLWGSNFIQHETKMIPKLSQNDLNTSPTQSQSDPKISSKTSKRRSLNEFKSNAVIQQEAKDLMMADWKVICFANSIELFKPTNVLACPADNSPISTIFKTSLGRLNNLNELAI